MSELSSIINVVIQTESAGVPRESFGVPLILAPHASIFGSAVTKEYADLGEMEDAGWLSTDGGYMAAEAMFSQEPKPERVILGKLTAPTQKYRLIPTVGNSVVFNGTINGTAFTFTADASGTVAEATAGLKTAIDALAISGVTTTDNGTSLDVQITAGKFFSVVVSPALSRRSASPMSVAEITADPGVAADLAAIANERDDWYAIVSPFRSKTLADLIATYAEAHEKLYVVATSDSAVMNTTVSGTDDVGESTASLNRTMVLFHEDPAEFFDAALVGISLPQDPGAEKWNLVRLSGVAVSSLDSTQRTNLASKKVTHYRSLGGLGYTQGGKVGSGEWTDIIRLRDAIKSDLEVACFNVLGGSRKVEFTDGGIARVASAVDSVLKSYQDQDPQAISEYTVTVPLASDVSDANKAARTLTDLKADATLAGAIYIVSPLRITLAL